MNTDLNSKESIVFFVETLLASLYVDEQALTRDQVILPKDFLNFNLQRHIKQRGRFCQMMVEKEYSTYLSLGKDEVKSKDRTESAKAITDDSQKLVRNS